MNDDIPWKIRFIDWPRLKVQLQFEVRDLWIGVFWRKTEIALHIYICIVPLFPIHITKLLKGIS